MEVRRASPGEAEILSRVAFEAKGHWGYPGRWMELWRDGLTVTPGFIADNEVYVAVVDGGISGFYAVVGEGQRLELEHIWVRPDGIGTGLGRRLFGHAMRRAAELGAQTVAIESDPNAEGFYLRMGARRAGERAYDLEGQRRELPILVVDIPNPRISEPPVS